MTHVQQINTAELGARDDTHRYAFAYLEHAMLARRQDAPFRTTRWIDNIVAVVDTIGDTMQLAPRGAIRTLVYALDALISKGDSDAEVVARLRTFVDDFEDDEWDMMHDRTTPATFVPVHARHATRAFDFEVGGEVA